MQTEQKIGDLVMNAMEKCWGFSYLNGEDADGVIACSSNFRCYRHRKLG